MVINNSKMNTKGENTPLSPRPSAEIPESICRICFEIETSQNPLISPCECSGSMKYIHEECLKKWICSKTRDPKTFSCDVCKQSLQMEINVKLVLSCKELKNEIFKILLFPIIIIIMSTITTLLIIYLITTATDPEITTSAKIYLSVVVIACCSIDCALITLFYKAVKVGCFQVEIYSWKIISNIKEEKHSVVDKVIPEYKDEKRNEGDDTVMNTSTIDAIYDDEPIFKKRDRLESGVTDCQSPTLPSAKPNNEILVQDAE